MVQNDTEKREKSLVVLRRFMPEGTAEIAYEWIQAYRFRFRISKSRSSRFGDYRSPVAGGIHKISVNHDLNKYAFLITFCHEVAHLITWEKYKDSVAPHGKEWKFEFSQLLKKFVGKDIFPRDVEYALMKYMRNPKASSCSDQDLYRVLRRYDENEVLHLEELPMDALFKMGTGRVFRKGIKKRTRYLCQEVESRQLYYVSGVAEVELVSEDIPLD